MSEFIYISVSSVAVTRAAARMLSVLLFVLSLVLPILAGTQAVTIHGRALDPQGVVLPGVTVTVKGFDGAAQSAVTDGDGQYQFSLLPGRYSLSGQLPGFSVFEQ